MPSVMHTYHMLQVVRAARAAGEGDLRAVARAVEDEGAVVSSPASSVAPSIACYLDSHQGPIG